MVAWTNEEGGRFAPGCMGSMSWSGYRRIEEFADVLDPDGIRFGDALAAHLAAEADLPRRPFGGRPHAYVEAHIEQGPRLEAEALDIGVVTGIQGSRWFTVTLTGDTAHAGTTPLALRRDAVQDMVRAIAALNALMHDPEDVLRFTVGRIAVEPNTSNSVANRASFTIDFRHPDKDVLLARGDAVAGVVQAAVRNAGVYGAGDIPRAAGGVLAAGRSIRWSSAAAEQGCGHMRLPSGAFHDAQFVVPVCPTGMIFVPCRKGISHNPAEYSEPSQLAAGTRVLTQTLANWRAPDADGSMRSTRDATALRRTMEGALFQKPGRHAAWTDGSRPAVAAGTGGAGPVERPRQPRLPLNARRAGEARRIRAVEADNVVGLAPRRIRCIAPGCHLRPWRHPMWKRCALVAAGCLSVAPAVISPAMHRRRIADIKRSRICSTASTKTIGTSIGTSKITMNNDGGWCWLSLWATHGSTLYVATFRVSQPPAHGQLLMGAVSAARDGVPAASESRARSTTSIQ